MTPKDRAKLIWRACTNMIDDNTSDVPLPSLEWFVEQIRDAENDALERAAQKFVCSGCAWEFYTLTCTAHVAAAIRALKEAK